MKTIKKYILVSIAGLGLLAISPRAAHANTTPAVCTILTQNLSYGMADINGAGNISRLQQFLISQSYLNNISPSGYFGGATLKAVKSFQFDNDLPSSGFVGSLTRTLIQNLSCGTSYNNNSNYNNNYNNQPVFISSLSTNSASVGSSVTIYGNGFDTNYSNTVTVGGVTTTGYSTNGTTLIFTVPQINNYNYNNQNCSLYYYGCQNQSNNYQVTVSNSRGTSNAVSIAINGNNNSTNYGAPTITNVTGPTSLNAGTQGVWNFTVTNPNSNSYITSSVRWGDENTYNYNANNSASSQSTYIQNQQTLSFTHTYQTAGYYTITFTVTDTNGRQNTATASVTVSGYSNSNNLTLSYLSPNQGRVGTSILLQGSGFGLYDNVVHFGNGGARTINSTNNGGTIYFTIPSYVSPCDVLTNGSYCALYAQQVTPGTYPVYVSNNSGQTNILYFTVTQ